VDNDGCRLETAAEILGISVKTANNQIASIKAALGANTIQGAVIKAIRLELIKI
jgi:DNA-binding CsgD family transcriptional regulator